jgi:hypothetical protein
MRPGSAGQCAHLDGASHVGREDAQSRGKVA